jgi:hypothetical protein
MHAKDAHHSAEGATVGLFADGASYGWQARDPRVSFATFPAID